MLCKRLNTEKTKLVIEMRDSVLLRLRTLMIIEHPGERVSLSEYLDEYVESTVEAHITELMDSYSYRSQEWRLLDSLSSEKCTSLDDSEELLDELPEGTVMDRYHLEGTV